MSRVVAALFLVTAAAGCPAHTAADEAWPEADKLFENDARFLGADSAYSAPLPGGRVLWLFGDSFAALGDVRSRRLAKMVRNSVAVQQGTDPSAPSTTIRFFFGGGDGGAVSSFFAEPGSTDDAKAWRWPGTPALVDAGDGQGAKLLLFFWDMRATNEPGAFGFVLDHTSAVLIDNPADDPPAWRSTEIAVPPGPDGQALGTGGALVDGDTLWLLAAREPGDHEMFLARVPVVDAARGDLTRLTFVADAGFAAQTELSLTHAGGAFQVVAVDGFGNAPLSVRTAPAVTGPWSGAVHVFDAPEGKKKNALIYSAKAHPELGSGRTNELVVTYCTNDTDLGTIVDDDSLYFPRFVRVSLEHKQ